MPTTIDIGSVAREGISSIPDSRLRDVLDAVYQSPQGVRAVVTAQRVFNRLTSSKWPAEQLRRFFSGWRSTHGTALFVSGLVIRIHREACGAPEPVRLLLHQAAAEIGEIIAEDTGVDDTPHNELFVRFASHVVGDDQWQLDRYLVPACERFRSQVKERRLAAPIEEAILTTAASESWNTGEYTYFDSLIRPWLTDILGHPADIIEKKVAYVTVHAGETELGHFRHALAAWELYCRAIGNDADPMKAKLAFECYLAGVGSAFAELEQVLGI